MSGVCSVEGCERRRDARGLCKTHWRVARLRGDFGPPPARRSCYVDGCTGSVRAKGLCNRHYIMQYRHDEVTPLDVPLPALDVTTWWRPTVPTPCTDHEDPDLWWPEVGETGEEAKALCAGCPERLPCLQWGRQTKATSGIWGGRNLGSRLRDVAQ